MKAGDYPDVNWTVSRQDVRKIEIYEHDVILSDDLLFRYQPLPDQAFVHYPLIAINDEQGSSYLLFITLTDSRSSRQILRDARKADLERV